MEKYKLSLDGYNQFQAFLQNTTPYPKYNKTFDGLDGHVKEEGKESPL
jgi:hypothetical protein